MAMSALPPIPDIAGVMLDVAYRPEAVIGESIGSLGLIPQP